MGTGLPFASNLPSLGPAGCHTLFSALPRSVVYARISLASYDIHRQELLVSLCKDLLVLASVPYRLLLWVKSYEWSGKQDSEQTACKLSTTIQPRNGMTFRISCAVQVSLQVLCYGCLNVQLVMRFRVGHMTQDTNILLAFTSWEKEPNLQSRPPWRLQHLQGNARLLIQPCHKLPFPETAALLFWL